MKQVPIRKLTTVIPYLSEAVEITNDGHVIGTYTPGGNGVPQEPVKKAIETEQVKQTEDGKLVKGLGEGWSPQTERLSMPKPAPKSPAKK